VTRGQRVGNRLVHFAEIAGKEHSVKTVDDPGLGKWIVL